MTLAVWASSTLNQKVPSPVGAYLPTSRRRDTALWATDRTVHSWGREVAGRWGEVGGGGGDVAGIKGSYVVAAPVVDIITIIVGIQTIDISYVVAASQSLLINQ